MDGTISSAYWAASKNTRTMGKWNYRIGTEMTTTTRGEKIRSFSVIAVYYDKKLKPNGFHDESNLSAQENFRDLKNTHKLIAGAFKKPIIDLDNFPKTYNGKK